MNHEDEFYDAVTGEYLCLFFNIPIDGNYFLNVFIYLCVCLFITVSELDE